MSFTHIPRKNGYLCYWSVDKKFNHLLGLIIEKVHKKAINKMMGRDTARILALELYQNKYCYAVSNSQRLSDQCWRYSSLDFNHRNFCKNWKKKYGNVQFLQIILDYFYIPNGTWMKAHWKKPFFLFTIPSFIKENMLDHTDSNNGVFLPFCMVCLQQIFLAKKEIEAVYTISFIYTSDLKMNHLWAATQKIDPKTMRNEFDISISQEEIYCKVDKKKINQHLSGCEGIEEEFKAYVSKIENINDVRMIRLKANIH